MKSGATRSDDGKELMYARQKIAVTAKAFGLQAIDMVHINFKGNLHCQFILYIVNQNLK